MRRREFLSNAALVPALATLPSLDVARNGPLDSRHGLNLGIVTYNIAKDWDLPTLIKNLTDLQFDAVELRTSHKHGVETSLSPAARAEVRQRFADSPVKLGGL